MGGVRRRALLRSLGTGECYGGVGGGSVQGELKQLLEGEPCGVLDVGMHFFDIALHLY